MPRSRTCPSPPTLKIDISSPPLEMARLWQILDLFAEDNRLNVYAGELEVRPPGAPTIQPGTGASELGLENLESGWRLHPGSSSSDDCYSDRSARSGSIFAARRAGR
jgi:hypothetical protein